MTRKEMIKVAKLEIREWDRGSVRLPRGLVLAILFAFVHRLNTGESVEESFFTPVQPSTDYEI